ncbi:MAG: NAD(P)-dependent oxidoreductase [Pirellulales bacterium]
MTLPRRVVVTGAGGNLGAKLAGHLAGHTELALLDRIAAPGVHQADLSLWNESWTRHFAAAEAVVHLAGDPVAYRDWPDLIAPNIDAMLNVYAAAAAHGVRRVVFASSNHVMGGYDDGSAAPITEDLPPKPGLRYIADGAERFSGAYAATKLFGERVGRQYADAHGIEVIAVRIGWVWRGINAPDNLPAERGDWFRKMWLSDRDFLHLMSSCLAAELPRKFLIVNGMSANTAMRWDITVAREVLGYRPKDDVDSLG